MNKEHYLVLKWTVSRGKDSYGYNICTIWDGNKPYRTCGGGYDMIGSVFAAWLKEKYIDKLKTLTPYDENYSMEYWQKHGYQPRQENYGLFCRNGRWCLDGACGFSAMTDIAKKIGLEIKSLYDKKNKETNGFIVKEI